MTGPPSAPRSGEAPPKAGGARRFGYRLFGLSLVSDIELPGLATTDVDDGGDVHVRLASVPIPDERPAGYSVSEIGTVLTVPGVGRFLIRKGREIRVQAEAGASERNLRLYLLGSALGATLHQRGMLPLHANAIELEGRIVAFCGHSGAGKSTIAAWFHDRGHRVLSDDVCVIAFEGDRAIAHPGPSRLRLWREALEATGRNAEDYERSFDGLAKYDVPTWHRTEGPPLPLDRIYLLGKAPEGSQGPHIRRLRGVKAVDALVANTYRGGYLRSIGRTREHLMACVRLAGAVPVFGAERIWGFAEFEAQARHLEQHARVGRG